MNQLNFQLPTISGNDLDTILDRATVNEGMLNHFIEQNDLDWELQKIDLTGNYNGNTVQTRFKGMYNPKNGEVYNTCTDQYQAFTNRELSEFALICSDLLQLPISSVKQYKDGAIRRFEIKSLETVPLGGYNVGDQISQSIIIYDSYNKSSQMTVGLYHQILSCTNGMYYNRKQDGFKLSHTLNGKGKLKKFVKELPKLKKQNEGILETYKRLTDVRIEKEHIDQVVRIATGVDLLIPKKDRSTRTTNRLQDIVENIEIEMKSKGGSAWGLWNGVTRWTTHSGSGKDNHEYSKFMGTKNQKDREVFDYLSSLI